ncbi:MAG: hypothetical protein ABIR63_02175 [Sphingomicrobium sp.]
MAAAHVQDHGLILAETEWRVDHFDQGREEPPAFAPDGRFVAHPVRTDRMLRPQYDDQLGVFQGTVDFT